MSWVYRRPFDYSLRRRNRRGRVLAPATDAPAIGPACITAVYLATPAVTAVNLATPAVTAVTLKTPAVTAVNLECN